MKPKKTKSGKWTVQVYLGKKADGKLNIATVTRPTKAECLIAAAELKNKPVVHDDLTVKELVYQYIKASEGVLSPTTVSMYWTMYHHAFPELMGLKVSQLTDNLIQTHISNEAQRPNRNGKTISPKTVKNEWGLISAALKRGRKLVFDVRLPQVQTPPEELPEPSIVLNAIKGTCIELPCMLALKMGLRMSEIKGLMCSSVRNGKLFIEQVCVTVDGVEIIKETAKTDASRRSLDLSPDMLSMINNTIPMQNYRLSGENQPLVTMKAHKIRYEFEKLKLGISFHDLRHLYASIMLNILNVPPKIVQVDGGWNTPVVLNKVYSQSFNSARQAANKARDDYFASL